VGHELGNGSPAGPDTAPSIADGDAYRDLHKLLPKCPSFSEILRKLMAEAQGRVVQHSPTVLLTKKAKRRANRKRNLTMAVRLAR
jgi:predicted CopG family antitoxin